MRWGGTGRPCSRIAFAATSALEKLLRESGISNDATVLLYGDNNNWFAAYAFWQSKYYGVRLIDGGRKKWLAEGLLTTMELPRVTESTYRATNPDETIRARQEDVSAILQNQERGQLDMRSWTNSPLRGIPKPLSGQGTFRAPRIFLG